MKNRCLTGLFLAASFAAPLAAQMAEGYLDIDIAQVKMGKRGDFDAVNKRMVEIARKYKSDNWLAYEAAYGQPNTVYFVTQRASYAAAEQGMKSWEAGLTKALGTLGMQKLNDAWDATVDKEQDVFRRRRWDLTASAPADAAAYAQLVGHARYVRNVTVRVRPGKSGDFEAQLEAGKEAQERVNPGVAFLVSQDVAGAQGEVFHIATLVKSLAEFDEIKPLQQVLGASYAESQRVAAEAFLSTETIIGRFLPELSNPPDEIASVDPKFWRPAPPPPPKPAADAKK